jgi:hypothetical protein
LIIAGIAIMGQLTGAYRAYLSSTDPLLAHQSIEKSWVTRWFDRVEPRTGRFLISAFGFFILGSVVGVVALAALILCSAAN